MTTLSRTMPDPTYPHLVAPSLCHLFAAATAAAAVDDAQRWTANEQQTDADMKCIKNSQFSDYF